MTRPLTTTLGILSFFYLIFISSWLSAQAPTAPVKSLIDTGKIKQPKNSFYTNLVNHPESDTKIFGKVYRTTNPMSAQLYPKGGLFGDTVYNIPVGATIELLSTDLPLNKTAHRMLVKVVSNPSKDEYVGQVGWMLVDHTTLFTYLDEDNKRIDTNRIRMKYVTGAVKLREEAAKTSCADNKKCKLEWAAYYDCMSKNPHYEIPAKCTLVNCEVKECPGDK